VEVEKPIFNYPNWHSCGDGRLFPGDDDEGGSSRNDIGELPNPVLSSRRGNNDILIHPLAAVVLPKFIRPPIPVDAQVDAQIVEPTKQPEQVKQANINPIVGRIPEG
jgi:hypothetical protein